MIVKVSTNNFYTNFKYKIKSNFRVMVIILILHLVAAPLNLANLIIYMLQEKKALADPAINVAAFNELYPVIGVVSTCLAALAGIILAMNIFNYLYKKSVVDMTLSLPLTTKQRFFSDFLAGAFTYLVPFIISSIISLIINGIGASIVPDWNGSRYGALTQSLITLIIAGFFIMLMVYILTILVLTCCGSMFESLAYTILVNVLIPGTIAVFGYIFIGNLYGIDLSSNIMPIIEKTSPLGALIGLMSSLDSGSTLVLRASWLIPFILVTAIYFIGSYFLYMKRKAESVSKPFVYKAFYYVMITGLTFCIGTLFTLTGTSNNIGPLVIITAIIYLIFEVVTNRGFAKFYMSVIRYVITIAVVIGLSLLVEKTDGFGMVDKIPAASNVKSVEMNYGGVFNKFSGYGNTNNLFTYTDENTINSVVQMHEMVIENYHTDKSMDNTIEYDTEIKTEYTTAEEEKMLSSDYNVTNITIKYDLKKGKSFTRTYNVSFDEYIKLIDVDKTNEFKDNYIKSIKEYYQSIKKYDNNITISSPFFINGQSSVTIDEDRVDELFTCLALDIKSLTAEEYYTSTKDTLGLLTIGYGGQNNSIAINENYTNVLMFLKKYNIKLPSVNDIDYNIQPIVILQPEFSGMDVDGITYYCSSSNYYYDKYTNNIMQNSADLNDLIKHIRMDYITTEPCYKVYIDGYSYIVPPEYSELAEKVNVQ